MLCMITPPLGLLAAENHRYVTCYNLCITRGGSYTINIALHPTPPQYSVSVNNRWYRCLVRNYSLSLLCSKV